MPSKSVYYPIAMLDFVAEAIDLGHESAEELCASYRKQEQEHGSINDDELELVKTTFKEGLEEYVPYFAEQLRRWQTTNLTSSQKQKISELAKKNNNLIKIYTDGIALIDRFFFNKTVKIKFSR